MTVPMLAVIAFVVLAGRVVQAQGSLQGAARSGARAASLARTTTDAHDAAAQAVAANLTEAGVACDGTQVSVDTTDFGAGGTVTVRVACGLRVADLVPLPVPGSRAIEARSVAVVDEFRQASK